MPRSANRAAAAQVARAIIELAIGFGILAIVIETWLVEGLLVPVVVTSDSMSPAVLGPHRQFRCTHCGGEFVSSEESFAELGSSIACPHCGAAGDPAGGTPRRGDRVLVDRSAFVWRAPRRWEVVVFRCPTEATMLCVKRVVGLPGESVRIDGGEIYVDGQLARRRQPDADTPAVQYTPGARGTTNYRLSADEYFLLGDNGPHSVDSRHWPGEGGVPGEYLVGKALAR